MSDYLVIRLDPQPQETASWVAVDPTGAILGAIARGTLADAAQAAVGRQVVVLVPAADVLRARADVPVKGGGKLLQALPFALEEQLAEDVEALHFAAGARSAEGELQAAVVRRELMDAWIVRLAAAGIAPQRIHSEADAVGGMPNTATLLVDHDGAVLVEPDGAVTAIDLDGVESLFELWLARRDAAAEPTPVNIVVYGMPELLATLDPVWERLGPRVESLEIRALADGPLSRLAAQIVTTPGINLLQGDYAPRSTLAAYWPAWRVAAMLLVALGVLTFVTQFAELSRVRGQVAELDATIDQAFHYVFPDAGPVQDARAQLSSRLQQLGERGARGSHEFLDALNVLSRALRNGGEATRVEAINYRAGTMELRVRAPNVESLDKIQQLVTQGGGLKAQIQSANASGDEVVGRLQITRAGG
jgi:general secretion pathway protein L